MAWIIFIRRVDMNCNWSSTFESTALVESILRLNHAAVTKMDVKSRLRTSLFLFDALKDIISVTLSWTHDGKVLDNHNLRWAEFVLLLPLDLPVVYVYNGVSEVRISLIWN